MIFLPSAVSYYAEAGGIDSPLLPDPERGYRTIESAGQKIVGLFRFISDNPALVKEIPGIIIDSELEPCLTALEKGRYGESAVRGVAAVLPFFTILKAAKAGQISKLLLKLANEANPGEFAKAAKEMISIKRLAGDLDEFILGARDSETLDKILELGELTQDEIRKLAKGGLLSDEEAKKALKALEDKKGGEGGVTITKKDESAEKGVDQKNKAGKVGDTRDTKTVITPGKKFKPHFRDHKELLENLLGTKYSKFKTDGPRFLEDIGKIIDDGTVKFVGNSTAAKDTALLKIYRGNGITVATKQNGEFVTLLESGKGMDIQFTTFMRK